MSNHRDRARVWGKPNRGEAGGKMEEEVRFNIHLSNEGNNPESLENLTDDDVFKELINIVVDVFSHKSENCMLTFQLPTQADGFATISSDSLCCASVSDCFIQEKDNGREKGGVSTKVKSCELIPSRKSSKHERNLKLPINKPSKHNNKKEFDKRLNPIVQTVLHAKQGFTDLETLFKLRHQSAYIGRWQQCMENNRLRTSESEEEQKNIGKEWENQKEVATWDATMKSEEGPSVQSSFVQSCYNEDTGDSNRKSNVYSQLHEVIAKLQKLMNTNDEHSLPDTHRIEYHIAEIKTHISAIRSYLFPEASYQSSSWDLNDIMSYPKTEKVGAFISRTRKNRGQDVALYRIATKKSFESRNCSCRRKNRNKNKSTNANKSKRVYHKEEDEAEMSLKNVLHSYQRVKRDETELVKVILRQLGLSHNMEIKRSHSKKQTGHYKNRRMSSRYCQTNKSYDSKHGTMQDSRILNHHIVKDSECNDGSRKPNAKVEQEIDVGTHSTAINEPNRLLKRGHQGKKRLTRQFQMNRERNVKSNCRKRRAKCTKPSLSSIIEKKHEETNVSCEEEFTPLLKSWSTTGGQIIRTRDKVFVEAELGDCTMPFKEENMMLRIQKATERLEHIQDLVEKKLGYLCKQKELYQETKLPQLPKIKEQEETKIEEQASKTHKELALKSKGSSSKELSSESQIDKYELPEAKTKSSLNCVRYNDVNLEETKDFRELLKGFETASNEVGHSKFKGKNKLSRFSEVEEKLSEDQQSSGKTYVCNYMMEMRGYEIKNDQKMDTSQIQLVSEVESDIFTHDSEKNQIPDRGDSNQEILEDGTKEDQEDDATVEGPLVNMNNSSAGCEKHKAESNVKKKISGSNSSRKSWCNVC